MIFFNGEGIQKDRTFDPPLSINHKLTVGKETANYSYNYFYIIGFQAFSFALSFIQKIEDLPIQRLVFQC